MADSLITPAEFAARWGDVTERWVIDARLKYRWPCVQVGRKVRFTEQQFEEIVRRHTAQAGVGTEQEDRLAGQTDRSAALNYRTGGPQLRRAPSP